MLETSDRVIRIICNVVLGVLIVMGFAMLGISAAHIFYRYVLNNSLGWSEELLKVLVVWFCLLSASFISIRRDHVSITIFKQQFPKKLEKFANLAVSFLMLFGSVVMCYVGIKLAWWVGVRRTPALKIPFFYLYASIFVSFGIMSIYELRNFIADLFYPGSKPALVDVSTDVIPGMEMPTGFIEGVDNPAVEKGE